MASRYLEYLIDEKEEKNAYFHDRLAELYLGITMSAKRKGEEGVSFLLNILWAHIDARADVLLLVIWDRWACRSVCEAFEVYRHDGALPA